MRGGSYRKLVAIRRGAAVGNHETREQMIQSSAQLVHDLTNEYCEPNRHVKATVRGKDIILAAIAEFTGYPKWVWMRSEKLLNMAEQERGGLFRPRDLLIHTQLRFGHVFRLVTRRLTPELSRPGALR